MWKDEAAVPSLLITLDDIPDLEDGAIPSPGRVLNPAG